MPEVVHQNPALKTLKGRDLWRAPLSSCSKRVRIELPEKNEDFESHLVDLAKDGHAFEADQVMQPEVRPNLSEHVPTASNHGL